jgi:hypothetical protein
VFLALAILAGGRSVALVPGGQLCGSVRLVCFRLGEQAPERGYCDLVVGIEIGQRAVGRLWRRRMVCSGIGGKDESDCL